jgi:uncharacterized protein (TIGR01319 family)
VSATAGECLQGGRRWERGLLLDVGSTFTKVAVVEPGGEVLAHSQALTSIDTDVLEGAANAVAALPAGCREQFDWALASSSAAGGLRMASVGLTAALSGRAATFAVLGAGAKVVAVEAGYLDDGALERLRRAKPHLLLLSGGVDGGNSDALRYNAARLASLHDVCGVVIAGNRRAAEAAAATLAERGRDVRVVDNVFPAPGELTIAPSREAIRELFMLHITRSKGLDGLMRRLRCACEPTPLAVSRALENLGREPVALVDVGGATTDVHSLVAPTERIPRARPPAPDVMRTVEGDLGVREGAPGIVDVMGPLGADLDAAARARREHPGHVPGDARERAVDATLAAAAVAIAVSRHTGVVVVRDRSSREAHAVPGRDLRSCRLLVATGGVFAHSADAGVIVRGALNELDGPFVPSNPEIAIDRDYVLYASGLVSRLDRPLAGRMAASVVQGAS